MKKTFMCNNGDGSLYQDVVFNAAACAKKDPLAINSTVGSLYQEDGTIVAFDCVYNCMNNLNNKEKASYASSPAGNTDFDDAAFNWLNRSTNITLPHRQIATCGGSGALYLSFEALCDKGSSVLMPDIAWGAYKMIIKQAGLNICNYQLVNQNNEVDLTSLFDQSKLMMQQQGKVVVLINDPAENPTGISLGKTNWEKIIKFYNQLSQDGPVVIINDVAYIDYCGDSIEYLNCFNDINENIFISVTMSFSKTLTAYGSRLGCNVLMCKDENQLDEVYNFATRICRSTWGSSNNVLMKTFVSLMNNDKAAYQQELDKYVSLLKERAEIFFNEIKKYKFNIMPYNEGFFCFIKCDNPQEIYNKLTKKHVYVVALAKGIRISLCSLSKDNCRKLPAILNEVINE